jgi:RNA polymerase sigma-70 factor (ECF subfamily)
VQTANQPTGPSIEFTSFLRAHQDLVFSIAARLTGDDAQAEDIAQEVFLRAYKHFESIRYSDTVRGWLKTVTTNLALNHLTRYRNRWRLFSSLRAADAEDDAPDVEIEDGADLVADLESVDREKMVEECLQNLPEHQRVPLVLYHFEELSYEDIARDLKVSVPKVKTDIFRGRAALAKILARRGVSATAQA